MPVNYVAPGPISMAGIYGRNNGGGGGGGGQVVQLHDDSMRQQNQLALAGLQGTIENDQINQRGAIQSQLAQQAAGLDAWQYQQRVTEQEAMQLRQDQNAIAAVDADTSLSPLEKMQAKTRIKSRIDWVSERQKRDLQQAQVEQAQAHASVFKQQAQLEQQRLTNSAALLQDKIRMVVDPTKTDEIREIIADSGVNPDSPEGAKMIPKVANERGWTAVLPQDKDGNVPANAKPIFGFGGQGGTHDAAGGQQGQAAGKPMTERDMSGIARHAMDAAEKYFKDQGKDPSEEELTAEAAKRMKIMSNLTGEARGGGDKAKVAAEAHQQQISGLDERKRQVAAMPNLSEQERQMVTKNLDLMQELVRKYRDTPENPRPKSVQRHLDSLKEQYTRFEQIIAARANKGEVPGQPSQPANQSQPSDQSTPRELRDDRPVFSSQVTPAEAAGNAARNAWDVLIQSAPSSAALRKTGPTIKKKLDDLGELLGFTQTARGG